MRRFESGRRSKRGGASSARIVAAVRDPADDDSRKEPLLSRSMADGETVQEARAAIGARSAGARITNPLKRDAPTREGARACSKGCRPEVRSDQRARRQWSPWHGSVL